MARVSSDTEYDVIIGTNGADSIDSGGARASINTGAGNDTIISGGFLSTVHGGAGNDSIGIWRSYIVAFGDDGNDNLNVNTDNSWDTNIANVTLTGGNGSDTFSFIPADHTIYGATIEDFDPDEDFIQLYADANEPLRRYITYDIDGNGDVVIHNPNGTINFTLKDIKDFSEIATVSFRYRNYNNSYFGDTTFERAVSGENILIESSGSSLLGTRDVYASIIGHNGDDTIDAIGSFSTVRGGAGNDTLYASNNYNEICGEDGDDYLLIVSDNRSFSNVSVTGGAGSDRFVFAAGDNYADSIVVTDFNLGDGDSIIFNNDNIASLHLLRSTNADGDLVFQTSDGKSRFILKGHKDFGELADVSITCCSLNGNYIETKTFEEMLIPYGITKTVLSSGQASAYVSSLYSGDIWLGGWDFFNNKLSWQDDSIVVLDARDATTGGGVLAGNSNDNLIYASGNGNQMWGGLGDNTLVGGAGSDNFWAGVGSTSHIENCSAADRVLLLNINTNDIQSGNANFNGDADGVTLNVGGENVMTVRRAENVSTTNVQFLDGTRWSYDYSSGSAQLMTVPRGLSLSDKTVSVTSAFEGDLWLSGVDQNGNEVWGSDYITTIDASADDGIRMLAGNANSNSIRAGRNGATLWGGSGGDDTLDGGAGDDMFIVGQGEGNSQIWYCSSDDLVCLWNINFSDLKYLRVYVRSSSRAVVVTTEDGTFIAVWSNHEETTNFKFADGSFMRYSATDNAWQLSDDGTDWRTITEVNGIPVGLQVQDEVVGVYSDYTGAFSLSDLNDSSVINISADNDTISGRVLSGDAQDNWIRANDYG